MKNWLEFDTDKTIKSYEYTNRCIRQMNQMIDYRIFEDMSADIIFQYLNRVMEIVNFADYLKRYLYEKCEMTEEFLEVPLEVYHRIISDSFKETNTPVSFVPTTKRRNLTIKSWLTQANVSRMTIFILGFGLKMTADEVSDFLMKVLKEDDFRYSDVNEIVYWYCFYQKLPYAKAKELLNTYENMSISNPMSENLWNAMHEHPEVYIKSDDVLMEYLKYIKAFQIEGKEKAHTYEVFMNLYQECLDLVKETYKQNDEHNEIGDPGPTDLEKLLGSGIPRDENWNQIRGKLSTLKEQFHNKRMTRNRIWSIVKKNHSVERFDLITLLFFIYSHKSSEWDSEFYQEYVARINKTLVDCNMYELYPVNPYEAFVLMCMVSDSPLSDYNEVIELSYK